MTNLISIRLLGIGIGNVNQRIANRTAEFRTPVMVEKDGNAKAG